MAVIFLEHQSTYMPINEPNLALIIFRCGMFYIQLIGSKDFIENIAINRDGSINFPEIGRIKLAIFG